MRLNRRKELWINRLAMWMLVSFISIGCAAECLASTSGLWQKGDTVPTLNRSKQRVVQPNRPDTAVRPVTPVRTDTAVRPLDTLKARVDTIAWSTDTLDAPITYEAEDSGILIIPSKQFILYGSAKVDYKDVNLQAGTIKYDQQTQNILAYGQPDTASDNPLNKPKLTQGGSVSISDSIFFNTKSQKGLTKNTFYQEGEMFIQAGILKKTEPEVAFAYKSRFTTCNLDTPHFAFRTSRMKVINQKFAVAGLTYPEFEGVPMPVGIPFGIFPMNRGRRSGLLPPQFAVSEDMGLGLEGLGYYQIMNDNWDATLRTNIYSYGGYMVNLQPRYYKRYRYTGYLDIRYQKTKFLNRDLFAKRAEEFTESSDFSIMWTHQRDNRARPGTSFSAYVNYASTRFNQYVSNNPTANFRNQMTSSISWQKSFGDNLSNLGVNLNHNQNNELRLQNINPSINYRVNTLYPFQGKDDVSLNRWWKKIGFSYDGNIDSRIPFYDTAFSFQSIIDTVQWRAMHNPMLTLSLPPVGPVIISPSISYQEHWYGQSTLLTWNEASKKVDTTLRKGFYRASDLSFGVTASTRIFGTVNFRPRSNVKALRHEIKPSIAFNYKPDLMAKHYYNVQVDETGKNFQRLSKFNGTYSTFSEGVFGGLSFQIDNLLEMKVKDKLDTAAGASRKVRLIDGLSIASSYNFLQDSFQLSPITLGLRSTLFEKLNITGNATLDPYEVNDFGRRLNRFVWAGGRPTLGRFVSGSLALSTSLQSKQAKDEAEQKPTYDPTMTPAEQQQQLDYIRMNPAEFVDFDIPWTVQLGFSMTFQRMLSRDLKGYTTEVTAGLNASGDFSLSPKWKIGGSSFVNVRDRRIESLTMFVSREMHCWQMAINITPVGPWRTFSISISPKSGILRDLRINRSRTFYQ